MFEIVSLGGLLGAFAGEFFYWLKIYATVVTQARQQSQLEIDRCYSLARKFVIIVIVVVSLIFAALGWTDYKAHY